MIDTLNSLFPNWHWLNLLIIPGLIIGFTIHELGHSLMAYFLGDISQVKQGNITANPLKHISWFGTILFIILVLAGLNQSVLKQSILRTVI